MQKISQRLMLVLILAFAGTLCCFSAMAAKPPAGGAAYRIVAFRPPQFTSVSSAVQGLNDQGQAVGYAEAADGGVHAVHLDIASGAYTLLQDGANAHAVNNFNESVGVSQLGTAAFWRSPSAAIVSLPALPGHVQSEAIGVNDAGIVVGWSYDGVSKTPSGGDEIQGVAWLVVVDPTGNAHVDGPVELPPRFAGAATSGNDVSALTGGAANIVGMSGDQVVVWTIPLNQDGSLAAPTVPALINTLGGAWSQSGGINDGGDVCGRSDTWPSTGFGFPFVTLAGQQAAALPVPRSTVFGIACDINNAQQMVGNVRVLEKGSTGPGREYAYLWKGGVAVDLNKQIPSLSGWQLRWAYTINNAGVIGGTGGFDVYDRGFLLIPNP